MRLLKNYCAYVINERMRNQLIEWYKNEVGCQVELFHIWLLVRLDVVLKFHFNLYVLNPPKISPIEPPIAAPKRKPIFILSMKRQIYKA